MGKITAYEIDKKFENLLALAESGKADRSLIEEVSTLKMSVDKKAKHSGFAIRESEAQIKSIKAKVKALNAKKARYQGLVDAAKSWVFAALKLTKRDLFSFDEFKFFTSKGAPQLDLDESKLPEFVTAEVDGVWTSVQIINTTITKAPDRNLIKKLLSQGCEIEGAKLGDAASHLVFE